jgi:hypothetical protein
MRGLYLKHLITLYCNHLTPQNQNQNQNQNCLFSLQLSDKHIYCTEHIMLQHITKNLAILSKIWHI